MKRLTYTLIASLLVVQCGWMATGDARSTTSYAPVNKYLTSESLFNIYYADFYTRYGQNYANRNDAFQSFCRLLRTSDMLADEMIQVGIPTTQIYDFLQYLEEVDIQKTSHETIRRAMLAIDYVLESVESSLARKYRPEFRREILARTPPVTHTG